MAVTVAAVMRACRNFFEGTPLTGTFAITGGGLSPAPDAPYVAIRGRCYHDGVHEISGGVLDVLKTDEVFEGAVYPLRPPDDFLDLCKDISAYDDKTPVTGNQSESFGGYSYTRASGASGLLTWQEAFAHRLIPFRRMFSGVM